MGPRIFGVVDGRNRAGHSEAGRRAVIAALACGLGANLGACSISPLPEDVTGYDTTAIVRKVRCEARDAVIDIAIEYLHRHGHLEYNDVSDLRALESNPAKLKALSPYEQRNLSYFSKTGIVYAFTLEGTETNGLTFSSEIIRPLSHGTESLTPTAADTLSRDNQRAFTISDNFLGLIAPKMDRYCDLGPSGPNYQYPIVGTIGIKEKIRTFIVLTLFGDLAAEQTPTKGINFTPGLPTMSDSITFTTTVTAGLTPAVVYTPVGRAIQTLNASLVASVSRVDKHQVIIGLGLPSAVTPVTLNKPATALVISAAPTGSGTGEAAAAQAVAQHIVRYQLPTPLAGAAGP